MLTDISSCVVYHLKRTLLLKTYGLTAPNERESESDEFSFTRGNEYRTELKSDVALHCFPFSFGVSGKVTTMNPIKRRHFYVSFSLGVARILESGTT